MFQFRDLSSAPFRIGSAYADHLSNETSRNAFSHVLDLISLYNLFFIVTTLTSSLVFCNRFVSSCIELSFSSRCFTDPVIFLILTSCSETLVYRFSLDTSYLFSRTTTSSLSDMSPLTLSVLPSMLGCDRVWTPSSSNVVDICSESVL